MDFTHCKRDREFERVHNIFSVYLFMYIHIFIRRNVGNVRIYCKCRGYIDEFLRVTKDRGARTYCI